MGPLAAERQRDRVEGYIAKGIADGATLATGGHRPKDLDRGWYVEPTVFGNVDNDSVIAQEEIFGPVLSRDPRRGRGGRGADRQRHHLRAQRLGVHQRRQPGPPGGRPAPVRHGGAQRDADRLRRDFGGFKQSGIGREGVHEGLPPFLETKFMVLEGRPEGYEGTTL